MNDQTPKNVHYLIDFHGCDVDQIESMEFWKKALSDAAEVGKLGIIDDLYHKFEPRGITALLLLSASHLSIHTWPENEYVACDLFSCSGEENAKKAVKHLLGSIKCEKYELKRVLRR